MQTTADYRARLLENILVNNPSHNMYIEKYFNQIYEVINYWFDRISRYFNNRHWSSWHSSRSPSESNQTEITHVKLQSTVIQFRISALYHSQEKDSELRKQKYVCL